MMPGQIFNVFVSYSHSDASLVAPVVKLLRVNKSLVFQDTDRIAPGKKWRDQIAKALAESNLVVVFWCDHARGSTEVSSEWKAAIEQEKDLLPLLLDGTPLPPELEQFQWIDFRGVVGATHNSIDSRASDSRLATPAPMAKGPRRAVWYAAGIAAMLAVVLSSSFLVLRTSGSPPVASAPSIEPPELPLPEAHGPAPIGWILLLLGIAIAVGTYFLVSRRRRARSGIRIEIAEQRRESIEHRIASALEEEILRRTAFR
jgi:hypothetical protein